MRWPYHLRMAAEERGEKTQVAGVSVGMLGGLGVRFMTAPRAAGRFGSSRRSVQYLR